MSLKKSIEASFFVSAKAVVLLVSILMLSACATPQVSITIPPPLLYYGPEQPVADVDVLAVSPAMDEFLAHYVLPYKSSRTRLDLLTTSVVSSGVLGFDYDSGRTLTASDAFESRSGNCVGFANMMIALARQVGLKAKYQEVHRQPVWSSHRNTVLLIKHVNVIIESANMSYVMDVSGIEISPNARRRVVDDTYAKALYLNNIGAEALLDNDLPTAYSYIKAAIMTDQRLTDAWINMGVIYGRNTQWDDAITVFQKALQIDGSQFSAMSNLYEVYVESGNLEAAEKLQVKVDRYRRNNPYHLLQMSNIALETDQYDVSLSLLERAIKKKGDDHMLHFAMARTQYLSGEFSAAQGSLLRARELAPQNMMAHYDRPLGDLVAEAEAEQDEL